MREDKNEDVQVRGILPKKKKQQGPVKKAIWRLIKVTLFLVIFLYIIFTVLTRIGGSSDTLRGAIEDVISEKTGYSAHIITFNNMSFFPDVIIDIGAMELRDGPQGEAVVTVNNAKVSMDFFDVASGGGKLKSLNVQNLSIAPGVITGDPINIKKIDLVDHPETGAAITLDGLIGKSPLTARMGLETEGVAPDKKFIVPNERKISLNIGDVSASAISSSELLRGFILKNLDVKNKQTKVLSGNINVKDTGSNTWSIGGNVTLHPNETKISPDIDISVQSGLTIKGHLLSERLSLDDFNENQPLAGLLSLFDSPNSKPPTLKDKNIDLVLEIKSLHSGAIHLGSVQTPLKVANNTLKIGPLAGNISAGQLKGEIKVQEMTDKPHLLNTDISIKQLDYGAFQKQFKKIADIKGKGNLVFALSSKAKTLDAFMPNLKGKVSFVTGGAKMDAGLLNLWGGGLLNALLPSLETEDDMNVTCAVMDFQINGGLAETNAFFVDMKRMTLRGEGVYRYHEDQVDMKIIPKAKKIALADIGTAVHVTGPLSKLSISPSAMDISKKIGGIILGAVNPAFFAVTLVDLGLNDNHPCKAFVIEKEDLPPPAPKKEEPALTPVQKLGVNQ